LWLARGVDIPTISVNVSAISLHSGSLSSIVDEALRRRRSQASASRSRSPKELSPTG